MAADDILEEVDLGLNAKGMGWIGLVWELDFDVYPKRVHPLTDQTL